MAAAMGARVLWRGSNGERLTLADGFEVYETAGRVFRRQVLADGSVLLAEGPLGLTRKQRPGVLGGDNALVFTCACCQRTSRCGEAAHEPGCGHPWAAPGGLAERARAA